jgi:hypothetical protein
LGDTVGVVPPHWKLNVGEFAVGGHHATVARVREKRERARAGRPGLLGRTEGASRARERESGEYGSERAARVRLGRAGGEAGKRPVWTVFVFLLSKNAK